MEYPLNDLLAFARGARRFLGPEAIRSAYPFLRRAILLADETATSDIEVHCCPEDFKTGGWYFLNLCPPQNAATVDKAVAHLEARGLLIRHPDNVLMVKIEDPDQRGQRL